MVFSHKVVSYSATPRTVSHRGPLSMEFSRQEHWCGLPFPSPGDPPDPGLQVNSLLLSLQRSPYKLVAGHFNLSSPEKGVLVIFKGTCARCRIKYVHSLSACHKMNCRLLDQLRKADFFPSHTNFLPSGFFITREMGQETTSKIKNQQRWLNLTVKSQSGPGQPWCEVQGSVDTKPFVQYDCDSNKVRPLGLLQVNDTQAWAELSQMLGEAGRELRMVLPVIKLDKKEMRGPLTLQVRLCGHCEAEQCSGAFLHFSLIGRTALLLDTMSITWTVINPGATGIKEEGENNQKLAEYFRKISTGDCSYWLREFLEHWENMLLPEPAEPLIMVPDIGQSASIRLVTCIILLIITQLVLIASSSWILWRNQGPLLLFHHRDVSPWTVRSYNVKQTLGVKNWPLMTVWLLIYYTTFYLEWDLTRS